MTCRTIYKLALKLGVTQVEQWTRIPAYYVTRLSGVGIKSLDTLRLYLARQGLTLRDDGTPEMWLVALGANGPIPTDFEVLIDNQEKYPFRFDSILGDADRDYRPMLVRQRVVSLGASHADYSVAGLQDRVAIERKSLDDAIGTFSGGTERRQRFENELSYLAGLECSAVVIEATRGQVFASAVPRGVRDKKQLAKSICRSVLAWEMDFRVPFLFCDSREQAEQECFRILERAYRKSISLESIINDL